MNKSIENMFKDSANELEKKWTGKNRVWNEIVISDKVKNEGQFYFVKGTLSFVTVLSLLITIFVTGVDQTTNQFTIEDYYSIHMDLGDNYDDNNELNEDFLDNLYY